MVRVARVLNSARINKEDVKRMNRSTGRLLEVSRKLNYSFGDAKKYCYKMHVDEIT